MWKVFFCEPPCIYTILPYLSSFKKAIRTLESFKNYTVHFLIHLAGFALIFEKNRRLLLNHESTFNRNKYRDLGTRLCIQSRHIPSYTHIWIAYEIKPNRESISFFSTEFLPSVGHKTIQRSATKIFAIFEGIIFSYHLSSI